MINKNLRMWGVVSPQRAFVKNERENLLELRYVKSTILYGNEIWCLGEKE